MEVSAVNAGEITARGKSAQSVGHRAKAAVSAAREAGAVLPSNAQGMAASAVARGMDPAALFAALIPPPLEPPAEPVPTDTPDAAPPTPEDGYASAGAVIGGGGASPEETALSLLEGATDLRI